VIDGGGNRASPNDPPQCTLSYAIPPGHRWSIIVGTSAEIIEVGMATGAYVVRERHHLL